MITKVIQIHFYNNHILLPYQSDKVSRGYMNDNNLLIYLEYNLLFLMDLVCFDIVTMPYRWCR